MSGAMYGSYKSLLICFVCNIHPSNQKPNLDLYNYVLNTAVLEKVDVVRDLGVHVDCFLKFDHHISLIVHKAMTRDRQHWIFRFFTGRKQAVISDHSGGQQSQWLPITQSVVQGSGIGPSAYLVYSMDLKTHSPCNSILKYANDTSILVPQHSSVSMQEEFQNVQTCPLLISFKLILTKPKKSFLYVLFCETSSLLSLYHLFSS